MADLLGADPRRHRVRPQHDPADLRPLPGRWPRPGGPGTRWWSPGSTTTPTSGPGCYAAEAAGATVRWVDFDPATGELTPQARGRGADRAHPAGRRSPARPTCIGTRPDVRADRRPGARGRRPAVRGRRAPDRARAGRRRRARRGLLRLLAVQVPRPALRRARRASRTCSSSCTRTSCCPPPRRSRSASSYGTLPYELLAGHDGRGRLPRRPGAGALRRPAAGPDRRDDRHRGARGPAAGPDRAARPGPARGDRLVPGRTAHPDPAADLRRPGRGGRVPASWPTLGVNAPAGSFYALEAVALAGPGRRRRPADRPGALHQRRRRRPAARRPGRVRPRNP